MKLDKISISVNKRGGGRALVTDSRQAGRAEATCACLKELSPTGPCAPESEEVSKALGYF